MEKNREARRGTMTAMMNGGLSKRRRRSGGRRDYPEDGRLEMQETTKLRDRGAKSDRDRDRSNRSNMRRMHGGHREDAEQSSNESVDDYVEEEDDEAPIGSRLQHPPKRLNMATWTAADEIGVLIPRKARSGRASARRLNAKLLNESWVSGSGWGGRGAGGGEQPSRSPSRLSPVSAAQISPTSSNASVRKKMKLLGGAKQWPPKMPNPSSDTEQNEIEIAEFLSRLHKQEDCDGLSNGENFLVSSSNSISHHPAVFPNSNLSSSAPLVAVAPKRKRPRLVKFEDSTTSSSVHSVAQPETLVSSMAKMDMNQQIRLEETTPNLVKLEPSPTIENGVALLDSSAPHCVVQQEPEKLDTPVLEFMVSAAEPKGKDMEVSKEEVALDQKETPCSDLDKATTTKVTPAAESPREPKFTIDLMALPEKLSPGRDGLCDVISDDRHTAQEIIRVDDDKIEAETTVKMVNQNAGESSMEGGKPEKSNVVEDFNSNKQLAKGKTLDLQFDLEKPDNIASSKHELPKQQCKATRVDPHSDKTVPSSLSIPMTVAGWHGSFPQFGFMGQVPAIQVLPPIDATMGSSSTHQTQNFPPPPVRRGRCSNHCYIAQTIQYNQKMMKMTSLWPAPGTSQLFGSKPPCNLNIMPTLDPTAHGNPLQGSFPGRSLGSLQDSKAAPPIFAAFSGHPSKDKSSTPITNSIESAQRKQVLLQQNPPQPGLANSMIQNPGLIFPLNQHQSAAAAVRAGAPKSTPGAGTDVGSSGSGGPAVAMNFGYPTEQYFAILQNNGYPFPVPAQMAGPPSYRGGSPAQAMPFFNGPFYPSQMLHHSMPASAPQQPPSHSQPGHQNTSISSGSSSSQKNQQRVPGGGVNGVGPSSQSLPSTKQQCPQQQQTHQSRQLESAADSQKSSYGHNLAMPIHPQNAALKTDLRTSQAYAMSFAAMNGGAPPSGIDLSSMAQSHALFQSLPEMARHGYQMTMAAAQQKKASPPQATDGGKLAGDSSMNANNAGEEESKMMMPSIKAPGISGKNPNRSTNPSNPNFQQFQLQKQAQELQLQQQIASTRTMSSASSNNASGVYSERLPPSGSTATKFPQSMTGFHQSLVQSSSPAQPPQWKTSGRMATPTSTPAVDSSAAKNHPQQQGRPTLTPSHQPQIGSPSNSASKSSSASAKPAPQPNTQTLLQQSYAKSSAASSSSRKSSPNANGNVPAPSNLGHPQQITPATNLQQYPPRQKQPQIIFSNASSYMQAQAPQSASYYREQQQQHHQKQSSNQVSSGMLALRPSGLSLAGSSAVAELAKGGAATGKSMKGGLPAPSRAHASQIATSAHPLMPGSAHSLMSGMLPYMSMPPMSVKPGDQKPAAGNDNLHACWQPEKRS